VFRFQDLYSVGESEKFPVQFLVDDYGDFEDSASVGQTFD
jgi:hypothetical protein